MTETLTDIDGMVEEAFDALECCFPSTRFPHEGNRAAYYSCHGCKEGWICQSHFRWMVDSYFPDCHRQLSKKGYLRCAICAARFGSVDDFCKVMTL